MAGSVDGHQWIDGRRVAPSHASAPEHAVIDPASGEVVQAVALAGTAALRRSP